MISNDAITQLLSSITSKEHPKNLCFDDADEYFCNELRTLYKQFIDCSGSSEDNNVMLVNMLNLTKNWIEIKCGKVSMLDVDDTNNK